jgi:hypothetical protein
MWGAVPGFAEGAVTRGHRQHRQNQRAKACTTWKSAVTNPKVNVTFRARRDDGLLRWKHTTPQRHQGAWQSQP